MQRSIGSQNYLSFFTLVGLVTLLLTALYLDPIRNHHEYLTLIGASDSAPSAAYLASMRQCFRIAANISSLFGEQSPFATLSVIDLMGALVSWLGLVGFMLWLRGLGLKGSALIFAGASQLAYLCLPNLGYGASGARISASMMLLSTGLLYTTIFDLKRKSTRQDNTSIGINFNLTARLAAAGIAASLASQTHIMAAWCAIGLLAWVSLAPLLTRARIRAAGKSSEVVTWSFAGLFVGAFVATALIRSNTGDVPFILMHEPMPQGGIESWGFEFFSQFGPALLLIPLGVLARKTPHSAAERLFQANPQWRLAAAAVPFVVAAILSTFGNQQRLPQLQALKALYGSAMRDGLPSQLFFEGEDPYRPSGYDLGTLRPPNLHPKDMVAVRSIREVRPSPYFHTYFIRTFTPVSDRRKHSTKCRLLTTNEYSVVDGNQFSPPYLGILPGHEVSELHECTQSEFIAGISP